MQATRWEELEPGPAAKEQREREREREKEKEKEKQNSYIESKVNLSICNLIKQLQSHVSTHNY